MLAVFLISMPAHAETTTYTVRLGEFKTLAAITEYYRLIPKKLHKAAMVCREGNHYILNCGAYFQEKDIQPLFMNLKELGLNPRIIKQDFKHASSDCGPADDFFAAAIYPPASKPSSAPVKEKVYADLKNPDVAGHLASVSRTLLPETTTKVYLSNRDVNQIICQNGPIRDVVYSREKGMTVKTHENNAFVKFLMAADPAHGHMMYSEPSEIYVVCGVNSLVYTLIAEPKNIPAQTIELASGKKTSKKPCPCLKGWHLKRSCT
ncbi:MAG: type-F conjugative transfer system secretin TraK [Desulfobacterales bacterium]